MEANQQPHTTGYEKIMGAIDKHNNKYEDTLYKHPSQVTESELKENMRYAGYETKDPMLKESLQKKTKEWFDYYYGTAPIKRDAAGRQIEPEPKYNFPKESTEVKTKDNVPMSSAFKTVAEKTAPYGAIFLQQRLNKMHNDVTKPKLKEDGFLGPKTTNRLKETLATQGLDEVNRNLKPEEKEPEEDRRMIV